MPTVHLHVKGTGLKLEMGTADQLGSPTPDPYSKVLTLVLCLVLQGSSMTGALEW